MLLIKPHRPLAALYGHYSALALWPVGKHRHSTVTTPANEESAKRKRIPIFVPSPFDQEDKLDKATRLARAANLEHLSLDTVCRAVTSPSVRQFMSNNSLSSVGAAVAQLYHWQTISTSRPDLGPITRLELTKHLVGRDVVLKASEALPLADAIFSSPMNRQEAEHDISQAFLALVGAIYKKEGIGKAHDWLEMYYHPVVSQLDLGKVAKLLRPGLMLKTALEEQKRQPAQYIVREMAPQCVVSVMSGNDLIGEATGQANASRSTASKAARRTLETDMEQVLAGLPLPEAMVALGTFEEEAECMPMVYQAGQ